MLRMADAREEKPTTLRTPIHFESCASNSSTRLPVGSVAMNIRSASSAKRRPSPAFAENTGILASNAGGPPPWIASSLGLDLRMAMCPIEIVGGFVVYLENLGGRVAPICPMVSSRERTRSGPFHNSQATGHNIVHGPPRARCDSLRPVRPGRCCYVRFRAEGGLPSRPRGGEGAGLVDGSRPCGGARRSEGQYARSLLSEAVRRDFLDPRFRA